MRKKIISILLTVVLAVSMITVAVLGVSADVANEDDALILVEATSNYFPQAIAEYDKNTNEITVIYSMMSSKDVLDCQWYLTYDPDVLSVSDKNSTSTVCPSINTSAKFNTSSDGIIKYSTKGSSLYDFSDETPFAQIVFDVKDFEKNVQTAINFQVEVLRVSKADENLAYISDIDEEVFLVNDNEVVNNDQTAKVSVDRHTKISAGSLADSVPTTQYVTSEPSTESYSTISTDPSAVVTESTILPYPILTVNSVSNYFPESFAEYSGETKEVTLTYFLKSSKDILATQWYLTYDPEVLSLSEKNKPETISKSIGKKSVLTTDQEGRVQFDASNIKLFDFSTEKTPFVQIVFDVKDISNQAPVITTVDLTVVELVVSSRLQNSDISDDTKEVVLVKNCDLMNNDNTISINIDRDTSLTPGTYIEPTTAVPTTVPVVSTIETTNTNNSQPTGLTEKVNEGATEANSTSNPIETKSESSVDEATSSTDTNTADSSLDILSGDIDNAPINTGNYSFAVITLLLLISATTIMFILRKRFDY